jgi:hypothetical protein
LRYLVQKSWDDKVYSTLKRYKKTENRYWQRGNLKIDSGWIYMYISLVSPKTFQIFLRHMLNTMLNLVENANLVFLYDNSNDYLVWKDKVQMLLKSNWKSEWGVIDIIILIRIWNNYDLGKHGNNSHNDIFVVSPIYRLDKQNYP